MKKILRKILSLLGYILLSIFFAKCLSLIILAISFILGKISLHYNYKIISYLLASDKAIIFISFLLATLPFNILKKLLEKLLEKLEKLEKYDEYDEYDE